MLWNRQLSPLARLAVEQDDERSQIGQGDTLKLHPGGPSSGGVLLSLSQAHP